MEKSFDPKAIETKWYARWEAAGVFAPRGEGAPYCILLPPPNVTGTLHMGHAFQQTLMDALIRHRRMCGDRVLWQGGTDHAGIATQKIVENQLAAEGKTRHDLGRERFVERVWAWKRESGSIITQQMRRLGVSLDWSRERFTLDAGLSAAVRRVFVEWYRAGLLYRGKRLVHWDPVLMTAVSDLEVNNEEREGSLWSIHYPAADGGPGIVVATTRPETMLGDVAVAVHPEDERYAARIGTALRLPLSERTIPVIADPYVDRSFGTGAVKITPAHDFNDYLIGQRHGLVPINVFTLDGRINDQAPAKYRGMDRLHARQAIVADLAAAGLLVATQRHKLSVPISQRSDAVIEPMLTDQWFLDLTRETLPDGRPGGRRAITEPALAAVRSGAIRFVPENWTSVYTQWLENIQDWCVSRQLWWGHRIPAWYDEAGNVFVGEDEADARAHARTAPVGRLRQDEDVLDTWFSSALWPFSTLGWPFSEAVRDGDRIVANWPRDQEFLPTAVLVTGFDIIFFWVARMVMATLYFTGRVPFREVYINALLRDAEGQKMSKSKGNTIDPLDLIDGIDLTSLLQKSTASLLIPQVREKVEKRIRREYPHGITAVGADALRFTFAALATPGRTINFDLKRAEGYKNFCNKLWNAARYMFLNFGTEAPPASPSEQSPRYVPLGPASDAELWILSRFRRTIESVAAQFSIYRFDAIAQALYEFVWNDLCDWFIELSKPLVADGTASAKTQLRHTSLWLLERTLCALHPIIPFITEEIWQEIKPRLGLSARFITERPYPRVEDFGQVPDTTAATADIEWLRAVLSQLRRIRSEMNIAPGKTIPLLLADGSADDRARADKFASEIAFLARTDWQRWLAPGEAEPAAATAVLGELRLLIPLAGLIDVAAERTRLDKEIRRLEAEVAKSHAKLAQFGPNTPPNVIEQEQQRVAERTAQIAGLRAQFERLQGLD
jgi:valyl-tRNA synthetase